jgi:hypothetical protein
VLGDLRARDVVTRASLGVKGRVVAERALVGDYNDYGAEIRGGAEARVFFPEEHAFELYGDVVFANVIGADPRYRKDGENKEVEPMDEAALRELLVPELVDEEGLPNHEAFIERLWSGQAVLR